MYRGRYRYHERGLYPCGIGGYSHCCPNPYLYQAYLNSNLYDYYYPNYPVISPYYVNPYFY